MSEQDKQPTEKQYISKVLMDLETPENIKEGKIVFPKKNCMCRNCHFSDWQGLEKDNIPDDEDIEPGVEPVITTRIVVVNYCHDRFMNTFEIGLPNVIACDGFYKQPKE